MGRKKNGNTSYEPNEGGSAWKQEDTSWIEQDDNGPAQGPEANASQVIQGARMGEFTSQAIAHRQSLGEVWTKSLDSHGELSLEEMDNIPILEILRSDVLPLSPLPQRVAKHKNIFSFAAGGWLKIYYFGVAKKLQEDGMVDGAKFMGSSAGSLVSAALALGLDFDKIKDFQVSCNSEGMHSILVRYF